MGLLRKPVRLRRTHPVEPGGHPAPLPRWLTLAVQGSGAVSRSTLSVAIFSLNHSAIGKTTHASGTAGAHVRYVTRRQAQPEIIAHLMPEDRNAARAWMERHEQTSRKNARVCDKLIVALPVELTPAQRLALLRDFADQISEGRVPYYAAIHAAGKDAHNPHAHLILVDRDPETGKRVLLTTEKGSTERFRERWEQVCNTHLALAGQEGRIDRRSLDAQGVEREPQIHVGAEGQHVAGQVARPSSRTREFGNAAGARRKTRVVDYPSIDQGRTRQEFNDQIVDFNLEKARRSPDFGIRQRAELALKLRAMKKLDQQRFAEARQAITRQSRADRASAWATHRQTCQQLQENRSAALAAVREATRAEFAPRWDEQRRQNDDEREQLRLLLRHGRLGTKIGHEAIARMRRGEDFVPGHLRAIFAATTHLPLRQQDLRRVQADRRKGLAREQSQALKERLAEVRAQSRDAYRQERQRYTGARAEQRQSLRDQWQDFYRQQAAAAIARESYRVTQEATISKVESAMGKVRTGWERAQAGQGASATSPAAGRRGDAGPSLGRG